MMQLLKPILLPFIPSCIGMNLNQYTRNSCHGAKLVCTNLNSATCCYSPHRCASSAMGWRWMMTTVVLSLTALSSSRSSVTPASTPNTIPTLRYRDTRCSPPTSATRVRETSGKCSFFPE
ncbi:hypothetical protein BU26DRAFT_319132 [Trematosphaeria pertusa]|uniref:Secreted protein n=1 Tax=Trematosphaeria pertusa TaxID=390896 RepID=A0A6A6IHK4_9PLEO|nr:uncharacterized protein BU26DRAFT_319132 [Trematosphaeria pertusa]KAF2249528.1 hypothetical protein BU26DRAFT_319132 [Trematosphaeria pertusa]